MRRSMQNLAVLGLATGLLSSGCSEPTYTTPLEEAQADLLTSHQDLMGFLTELKEGTGAFTMDTVGMSSKASRTPKPGRVLARTQGSIS